MSWAEERGPSEKLVLAPAVTCSPPLDGRDPAADEDKRARKHRGRAVLCTLRIEAH